MPITIEDVLAMEILEERLRTLLPEPYRDSYETLEPVPMRSAGLKYDAAGRVAWDEIWATFCDLAMAGGPPHRGALLEPGAPSDIDARPADQRRVVEELRRGLTMVTGRNVRTAAAPGWVQLDCDTPGMAAWLARAIVMENVAGRCEGDTLHLPAGPAFRLEKEIRNVITATAKTCHYWTNHTPDEQKAAITRLLVAEGGSALEPLWKPDRNPDAGAIGDAIQRATGLRPAPDRYANWIGLVCPGVQPAIWMMRALVANGVFSRREDAILYVPVNPRTDPGGRRVVESIFTARRLAAARKVL